MNHLIKSEILHTSLIAHQASLGLDKKPSSQASEAQATDPEQAAAHAAALHLPGLTAGTGPCCPCVTPPWPGAPGEQQLLPQSDERAHLGKC